MLISPAPPGAAAGTPGRRSGIGAGIPVAAAGAGLRMSTSIPGEPAAQPMAARASLGAHFFSNGSGVAAAAAEAGGAVPPAGVAAGDRDVAALAAYEERRLSSPLLQRFNSVAEQGAADVVLTSLQVGGREGGLHVERAGEGGEGG
jgi:hypothetical protein